jgi:hypothetical protein
MYSMGAVPTRARGARARSITTFLTARSSRSASITIPISSHTCRRIRCTLCDVTSLAQANNYNFTGQLSNVLTISPTVVNEFRLGGVRELDSYHPPSLGKNDPTTTGLEPAYGSNAPANVFPKISIDQGAGVGCIAEGSGCGENGNIDAVLGTGTYNASDILTLVRGRHTIKVGGELDKNYQNYTSWGDITSDILNSMARHRNSLRGLPCWRCLRMVRL